MYETFFSSYEIKEILFSNLLKVFMPISIGWSIKLNFNWESKSFLRKEAYNIKKNY